MLTTLEELQDDTSYFVLICSTRRRRAYQEVLDQSSHPIVVVDTPEEALRQVVRRPPIAVIVDMITGMRAGASNTSLLVLYNLELAWPVVRGTTKQNEPISIVATSPSTDRAFCRGTRQHGRRNRRVDRPSCSTTLHQTSDPVSSAGVT